jgi:hypothetical protein
MFAGFGRRLLALTRGEPLSPQFRALAALGVLVFGGFAFLSFNRHFVWLLHWPLTRTIGIIVPIAAAFLLSVSNLRARAAAIATGPVLAYVFVGLAMSAWFIGRAIADDLSLLIAVLIFDSFGIVLIAPFMVAALHGLRASPNHRQLAMISFLATFSIPALDAIAYRLGPAHALQAAIDGAREGDRIRIADYTNFEWDRFEVFGWYMSDEEVDKTLGFAWDDPFIQGAHVGEDHHLYLFVKDHRVVHAFELFSGEIFCTTFANRGRSREEAVFEVAGPVDRCLRPPRMD